MKAYADIEQSKALAEILPIKSADMRYAPFGDTHPWFIEGNLIEADAVPCWSLNALLNVLPSSTLDSSDDHHYRVHCMERFTEWHDNAVDACVAMILKLHEGLTAEDDHKCNKTFEQECAEGRFSIKPNRSMEEKREIMRRTALTKEMTYEERLAMLRSRYGL